MSKTTRTELVRIRMDTYRTLVPPAKRCETCSRHTTQHVWGREKLACTLVDQFVVPVKRNAVCDAWQDRS